MMSALETARQTLETKRAIAYAALIEMQKLGSQTYINERVETELKAAGLPIPANSYTYAESKAKYNAMKKTAKEVDTARKIHDELNFNDMLAKYQANQR
jgi:hypothetical protein